MSNDSGMTREQHVKQLWCALVMLFLASGATSRASAQDESRVYAGAVGGISTLSADGRASTHPTRAEASLYKPENGPALNLFVGMHLSRYFSVQSNYVWNRNDLTLFSSSTSTLGGGFRDAEDSGSGNRGLPPARSRARSTRASRHRRATDQICGRRLMRAKRRAPMSCRRGCRRKEPLHSDARSGASAAPFSAGSRAGGDNFGDSRGDNRQACKSRSRLYLAFSPR
jgi:hypothetical protein